MHTRNPTPTISRAFVVVSFALGVLGVRGGTMAMRREGESDVAGEMRIGRGKWGFGITLIHAESNLAIGAASEPDFCIQRVQQSY